MATLADKPAYRAMTVGEFLELEIEGRAELEDGVLYMMAGGSFRHAAVVANILAALSQKLRGSGCRPLGSDFAVRTGPATLRLPDVSVYRGFGAGGERNEAKLLGDPKVIFEVLSPSTSKLDQNVKLFEYQVLEGVAAIVFVDPDAEICRLAARTGPAGWSDRWLEKGGELPLTCLDLILSSDEMFAGP